MKHRLMKVLAAVSAAAGLAASGAQAQTKLVKAEPAGGAQVTAPDRIQLHFDGKLAPKLSGVGLMRAEGPMVAVTTQVSPSDPTVLIATPKAPLAPGAYMVMWQAVGEDGKKAAGDFDFTVKQPPP